MGRMFESVCVYVCLFVCLEHDSKKRTISKCSNLALGMILGYPRSDMVMGLKAQSQMVKCIFHTTTMLHRHSPGGITSHLQLCRAICYLITFN